MSQFFSNIFLVSLYVSESKFIPIITGVRVHSSIDNSPIQCEHGKVPASKVTSMKRLSAGAWHKLFSKVRNFYFLVFISEE